MYLVISGSLLHIDRVCWLLLLNGHVLQMVTEHSEKDSEGQMELPDDDEEDLCRVWDMAMDKVELFISNP